LPTIEPTARGNKATAVRRVIVSAPPGEEASIAWLRRALSGQELIGEKEKTTVALLSLLPATDSVVKHYIEPSSVWSTVTPVIMIGHDDNNQAKAERLLRKCLVQGGISPELAASAQLEWRRVGFRAGVELATRYVVPACLDHRARYHVQIRWVDADGRAVSLQGPFAFGAGRYGGLGLMASHRREGANG
jgi:CRISPR-associated protein Csb2